MSRGPYRSLAAPITKAISPPMIRFRDGATEIAPRLQPNSLVNTGRKTPNPAY
jgi:hypothetical protein